MPLVSLMVPENVEERLLAALPIVKVVPPKLFNTTLPLPSRAAICGVKPLKFTVPMPKPPSKVSLLTVTVAVAAMLRVVLSVALSAARRWLRVGLTVTLPVPKPPATALVTVPALTVVPPPYGVACRECQLPCRPTSSGWRRRRANWR